jgi:hypothetical protein
MTFVERVTLALLVSCVLPAAFVAQGAKHDGQRGVTSEGRQLSMPGCVGFESPLRLVIRSRTEWESFWEHGLAGRCAMPAPLTDFDFQHNMLLLVAVGGAERIEVKAELQSAVDGFTRFDIRLGGLGRSCITTGEVRTPLVVMSVPLQYGTPIFRETTDIADCPPLRLSLKRPAQRMVAFDRVQDHLFHSFNSGARAPIRAVARDSASLAEIWQRIRAKEFGAHDPWVNFDESMVLVAALGQQLQTGEYIRIDSLKTSRSENVVSVLTFTVDDRCSLPSGMSSPIDVVVTKRNWLPVRFVEQRIQLPHCGEKTPRTAP